MLPRKLKDIDVAEISLVDEAATHKKFFIQKRRRIMEKLIELLKSYLGEDTEVTAEQLEKIKAISEEGGNAIHKALECLDQYKEELPEDYVEATTTLVKASTFDYPAAQPEELTIDGLIEKAGKTLSKATIAQLNKIKTIVEGLLGEIKNVKKEYKIEGDDSAEVLKKLEELEKLKSAERERLEKEKKEKAAASEQRIKSLEDEIEKLKKADLKKQGLEGQTDDDDDEDKKKNKDDSKKDHWPSLGK